jgi:hypothetical protein
LLYVPFILPFFAMSLVTVLLHRRKMAAAWHVPFREAVSRVKGEQRAALGGYEQGAAHQLGCGVLGSPAIGDSLVNLN